MSGVKYDEGKPRYDLVPRFLVEEAAKVFAFGAEKYGDRNWEQGLGGGRLYAAMQRHLTAWQSGEDLDPESGLSHLGHAACCLMMMGEFALMRLMGMPVPEAATDDRPKLLPSQPKPPSPDGGLTFDLSASVGSSDDEAQDSPHTPDNRPSGGAGAVRVSAISINTQPVHEGPDLQLVAAAHRARHRA